MNFRHPILVTRNAMNTSLSDIKVYNCSIEKEFGLFQLSISKLNVEDLIIENCSSNKCAIVVFSSVNIYMHASKFNSNHAVHELSIPLIFVINSIVEFDECEFENNFAPLSYLVKADFFSYMGFWNLNFANNNHAALISLDTSFSMFNISNSSFIGNKGMILNAPRLSNITLDNMIIKNNIAMNKPLMLLRKSNFIVYNITFESNEGEKIISLEDCLSISINNITSNSDAMNDSLIKFAKSGESNLQSSCFFNSSSKKSIILSKKTKLKIVDLLIKSANSRSIISEDESKVFVADAQLIKPLFSESTIWVNNSQLIVQNSSFVDNNSIRGKESRVLIDNVNFSAPKDKAHDDWMITSSCNYGKDDENNSFYQTIIAVSVFGVILIVVYTKKKLNRRKRKKYSSDEGSDDELLPLSSAISRRRNQLN